MTTILLRSGCPQDLFLHGEDGYRVFDFALQLRETLRIRGLDQVIALLAIPKCHESGQRVDWYAPTQGRVTNWANAEQHVRDEALRRIADSQQQLCLAREDSRATGGDNGRIFAALLSKVLYFPSHQYIYFIDDKPIITFWGFSLDEQAPPTTFPQPLDIPNQSAMSPEIAQDVKSLEEPGDNLPDCRPKPQVTQRLTWPYLLLLGCGVIGLPLTYCLNQTFSGPQRSQPLSKPIPLNLAQSPIYSPPIPSTLPVEQASVATAEVIPLETIINRSQPPSPPTLSIPAAALKRGSTAFLTGQWQVEIADTSADHTGLGELTYTLRDNTGNVASMTTEQGHCRAKILSGWLPSGTLRIKPSSEVRCNKNASGTLPTVLCKINSQGETLCKAYSLHRHPIAIRLVQVPTQCE